MRRFALAGGWVLVVALATALTWQVVSAADAQVSDRPASPLNVAAPQFDTTTTSPTTTQPSDPVPSTSAPDRMPSTTNPTSTTTTTTPTPSTTAPQETTTTEGSWMIEKVSTAGGTVVLKYRPDEVVLQTATPAPGFRAEVEKWGPPEVELEFESDHSKFEIRAKWDGGDLKVEISGEDED